MFDTFFEHVNLANTTQFATSFPVDKWLYWSRTEDYGFLSDFCFFPWSCYGRQNITFLSLRSRHKRERGWGATSPPFFSPAFSLACFSCVLALLLLPCLCLLRRVEYNLEVVMCPKAEDWLTQGYMVKPTQPFKSTVHHTSRSKGRWNCGHLNPNFSIYLLFSLDCRVCALAAQVSLVLWLPRFITRQGRCTGALRYLSGILTWNTRKRDLT